MGGGLLALNISYKKKIVIEKIIELRKTLT